MAIVGYFVLLVGALLIGWPAWTHRTEHENPALVLLIVWIASGVTHGAVADIRAARTLSAFWSVVAYIALVVFTNVVNEMFFSGMIVAAVGGYAVAFLMGLAVAGYHRPPGGEATDASGSNEDGGVS